MKRFISKITKRVPKLILSLKYYKAFHRKINLKKPVLFWDKVFFIALYTDTTKWSELADKYEVQSYVRKIYSSDILNKIYGVYNSPNEINYDDLPKSFVIKTTNGCATNVIVKNKEEINKNAISIQFNKWLKYPYGDLSGQLHYSKIKPRIIIEKLLIQDANEEKSLTDYKFYCFNGKPLYCNVLSNRTFNTHKIDKMIYDMEWNPHPEYFRSSKNFNYHPKPKSFNKMKEIATKLSTGFPFVRIDLYEINENPIFGEYTFTPGTDIAFTTSFQKVLGDLIQLSDSLKIRTMQPVNINSINIYPFRSREMLIASAFEQKKMLIAINAEKILHANEQTRAIINDNIGYADGIGAVMALNKKGQKNAVKIPGCELWLDIIEAHYEDKSYYLIGGKQEVIEQTVKQLKTDFPGINIVAWRNGYIKSKAEQEALIHDIANKKPDVVFVAMGSPKQEVLMQAMQKKHKAVYQGLGGSFDVYTGNVKRAPEWWINHKLEWAYRLVKQPTRIKRQIHLLRFFMLVKLNKI